MQHGQWSLGRAGEFANGVTDSVFRIELELGTRVALVSLLYGPKGF
jgi:hypothetical protein